MRPADDDTELEREAARLLRAGNEPDAATRLRLERARRQALAELDRGRDFGWHLGRRGSWPGSWALALGTAGAATVAIALWLGSSGEPRATGASATVTPPTAAEAAELEAMLNGENLELIEELEFYDWLAMQESEDGDAGTG